MCAVFVEINYFHFISFHFCLEMSENVRKCRDMSGNVNTCRKMSGNVGICREMSGYVGKCRDMSGNVGIGICQELSRNVGKCQEMSGNVRKCQEMSGYVGKCRDMSGNVGKCRGHVGKCRNPFWWGTYLTNFTVYPDKVFQRVRHYSETNHLERIKGTPLNNETSFTPSMDATRRFSYIPHVNIHSLRKQT